jgi:hypothetical protein
MRYSSSPHKAASGNIYMRQTHIELQLKSLSLITETAYIYVLAASLTDIVNALNVQRKQRTQYADKSCCLPSSRH